MSSYAAVISLKQTIVRLLNSCHISILIGFAYNEVLSLQQLLKRLDSSRSSNEKVHVLDGQMRDAVRSLEDVLEYHVSKSESHLGNLLQVNLQDIDFFTQMVKKMKEDYVEEFSKPSPKEDDAVLTRSGFGGQKTKMVGLLNEFRKIKNELTDLFDFPIKIISLVGMAGIGKTTLANKIFEDPLECFRPFSCRAWVTIGQKYQLKEIVQGILAQVNPGLADKNIDDEKLVNKYLYESLKGRRYLIVLDDVWDTEVWDYLKRYLPDDNMKNRVLLTTRLHQVAESAKGIESYCTKISQMRFLNEEESWELLCDKVFGEESCPNDLKKAGKKIAEDCEGLPLTIVTVADLLCRAERTAEYWKKVAEKENSIFMDAQDQMTKVLLPSYNYLPQHLKACFLYMGVFPQSYEIPPSKLIKLWSAEGFLELDPGKTIEDFAAECLEELVYKSVVMVKKQSSTRRIKTCYLHSVFWNLCIREAGKNKFFLVLNNYTDSSTESMKSQRGLCIYNNILFCIKDVYNSMASISSARSLLCTGPPHQYPVQLCFGLKLLRVLDALTVRFYEFPMKVLKLVQLRYLALTYNGKLPDTISKLRNLQYLIVHRHPSIKSSRTPSYMPMQIWDIQELKHLEVMGCDLQNPCSGSILPNLLTLLGVSAQSCTKEVLERIPNLKKLGIQIEWWPDAAEQSLSCFDHVSHLHGLKSLKCVIVNPKLRPEVVSPLPMFPLRLQKLSFSGLGYPWKHMRVIAKLPHLKVLKLQNYAFRGPKWVTYDRFAFLRLQYLIIEDTDLVHWTARNDFKSEVFQNLKRLVIKNCYKLETIPWLSALGMIELVDCGPLAVDYAKQMQKQYSGLRVHLRSDVNHKL